MPESTQHKLDRIRPPRVQITYDVETRGSFVKMELPFVVGIMANLSGNVDDPKRPALRDRKYMEIDRDNFNDIMGKILPQVSQNGSAALEFKNLDDFNPVNVLKQLNEADGTHDKFKKRTHLSDMVAKLDGNVKLQKKFLEVLASDEKRAKMKSDLDALRKLLEPKQDPPISSAAATTTVTTETPKAVESKKANPQPPATGGVTK